MKFGQVLGPNFMTQIGVQRNSEPSKVSPLFIMRPQPANSFASLSLVNGMIKRADPSFHQDYSNISRIHLNKERAAEKERDPLVGSYNLNIQLIFSWPSQSPVSCSLFNIFTRIIKYSKQASAICRYHQQPSCPMLAYQLGQLVMIIE